MGSNFNADDIHAFLRNIPTSSAYRGYEDAPYPGYGNAPRWVPPVTSRDLLDNSEYSQCEDAQSEYTATSTMRSAASSSVFDSRHNGGSSYSRSSAPSRGFPQMSFAQQFAVPGTVPERPGQILWCEFCELKKCSATFSLEDERGWIDHHVRHLRDRFPQKLMCWFCDHNHAPFVAADPADGLTNFVDRMQHIRGHIVDDHRWTSEYMRPDFHVIEHLFENGLLSERMFKHAMAYDETPPAYQLPGSHSQSSSYHSAASKERGQYYDLERERRAERRRQRERPAGGRRR